MNGGAPILAKLMLVVIAVIRLWLCASSLVGVLGRVSPGTVIRKSADPLGRLVIGEI
jgi:hypothetical protein